ncbi:MAG: Rieske 2Fe-2S domain-containing protein [Gammaproteobacteria bacterium]|jgi:nitrite reductase/ring-hydroxylating ferredoxin subunit|nr:Rieske 2Fe-2S domain-containing protein [Gammaproteobacteria bacterium]
MASEDVSETLTGPASAPLLALDALAPGTFAAVDALLDGIEEPLILHRAADGAVRAWLNVCPHAGRRLDWAPGRFLVSKDGLLVCAVHGAAFEAVGGVCEAGPCRGESLRAVAVQVRDGAVWLA